MVKDNPSITLIQLLKELKIKVTRDSLIRELSIHPNYPSLLAYSEVLDRFRIPNASYHIGLENLNEISCPFIAFVSSNNGEFLVVKKFEKEKVLLLNDRGKNQQMEMDDFVKIFTGKILLVEADVDSGEVDYEKKKRKEILDELRIPFILFLSFVILIPQLFINYSHFSLLNFNIVLVVLVKSFGLLTCLLLLIHTLDANNSLTKKICKSGKNTGCNSILSSKAAKIVEGLTWSEVGFFYFSGTIIVLVLNSYSATLLQVIALLNILSLPYTIYSIYYQYRVARQWCILCCTIQTLLWMECLLCISYLRHSILLPDLREFITLIISFSVPVLVWILIKPLILSSLQLEAVNKELRRFKYSKALFKKLLSENVCYSLPDRKDSIILGNEEAENIVTLVTNPYCEPCAIAHKTLDEWLTKMNSFQLRIIFSTISESYDPKTKVAAHMMQIQLLNDQQLLKSALSSWYAQKQKNYELWAKSYPIQETKAINETLEIQKGWCQMVDIQATPTVLINGRKLPAPYKLDDIQYLI